MREKWNPNAEFNEAGTTMLVFMDYYNNHIPDAFPKATEKSLKAFREAHLSLFEEGEDLWSIDKHRKRLMDWLQSYREPTE